MVSLGDRVFLILEKQLEDLTDEKGPDPLIDAQFEAVQWLLQMPQQALWRKALSDLGDEILPHVWHYLQ